MDMVIALVMAMAMVMLMATDTITTVRDILIEITIGVTRMTVIRIQGMDRIIGGEDLELQFSDQVWFYWRRHCFSVRMDANQAAWSNRLGLL